MDPVYRHCVSRGEYGSQLSGDEAEHELGHQAATAVHL